MNCRGRLLDITDPVVMGIINVTADSFYEGSRATAAADIIRQAEHHLTEGASILDIGAMSSRPGAHEMTIQEEIDALVPAIQIITSNFPDVIISADVYRGVVANAALNAGAHIINDIGGGTFDQSIMEVVARAHAPYILMHNRAKSLHMMHATDYDDVMQSLIDFFFRQVHLAREAGIDDIILDPGIGFSKTITQNFEVIQRFDELMPLDLPFLVGISRKSFIYKTLNTTADYALNGTSAIHALTLAKGATILRVHDVKEAMECITLHKELQAAVSKT